MQINFQPKDGGEPWTATLREDTASGYDVVLFLDKEKSTEDSGLMVGHVTWIRIDRMKPTSNGYRLVLPEY